MDEKSQIERCESCGEPVNVLDPGYWKSPNDEQFWHDDCFDKLEHVESIAAEIRNIMIPEADYDGYSDEFHDRLDNAQAELETAVKRERLHQEQKD